MIKKIYKLKKIRYEDRQFITSPIGEPTDLTIIRGRQNVPVGDCFSWWSCHYEYKNIKTGETFTIEGLQNKYQLGFLEKELWNIIERNYLTEEIYIMSCNHPRSIKRNDLDLSE